MTYQEFYAHIDCHFLYHDTTAWQQLITQSLAIGGDAPFLVLHEICRLLRAQMRRAWSMRNMLDAQRRKYSGSYFSKALRKSYTAISGDNARANTLQFHKPTTGCCPNA
jgi:hypothetical protein